MPDLEQSRRGMAGRLPDPNQSNPCHATPKTISSTPVNCQREARVRTRTHSHARTCCLSAHAGSESGCRRNGKTLFTVAVAEGREQQNYRGNEGGGRDGQPTYQSQPHRPQPSPSLRAALALKISLVASEHVPSLGTTKSFELSIHTD